MSRLLTPWLGVVCVSDFAHLEPEHELFLVYGKGRPGIIRGMDMGAKVPDEHMIPIENLMNPRALDFHAETGFIYFADTTSYLIGRQKIDGTERETILKDGEAPHGRTRSRFSSHSQRAASPPGRLEELVGMETPGQTDRPLHDPLD